MRVALRDFRNGRVKTYNNFVRERKKERNSVEMTETEVMV
jgi:hypothetical protein